MMGRFAAVGALERCRWPEAELDARLGGKQRADWGHRTRRLRSCRLRRPLFQWSLGAASAEPAYPLSSRTGPPSPPLPRSPNRTLTL